DLSHARRLAGANEFVARREDRHLGPPINNDLAVSHGCRKRQLARTKTATGTEQTHALTEIAAARADMIGLNIIALHEDVIALALRVLLDDDAVGAIGNRRTREDADGFACTHAATERMPRGRLADDFQLRRQLRDVHDAHGIAIHRGSIERRLSET